MKNKLIPILLVFITLNSFGQISFEKGYFIDNQNQRVECLIKNVEWKDNPKEFEYKLSEGQEVLKGNLSSVKEFGVTGTSRFVRVDTKIDISPTDLKKLSKVRDPVWSQEVIFLKVLVEGIASLYFYEKDGLIRYFYSTSDTSIQQLIYKEYYDATKEYYVEDCEYSINNKFHDQLWSFVRCPNTTTSEIEKLNYWKSDLEKYFVKYNECNGNSPLIYDKKGGKDRFHLKLSPGTNFSILSITNGVFERYNTDFDNQLNFRIGVEAELILPFNRNKWGFIFEPTYQYFNAVKELSTSVSTIHYNSIEFPVGLRYYLFLNPELKLFADAMYIPSFNLDFNSTFVHQSTISSILPSTMDITTSQSYASGVGLAYKKYSAEFRYYTNRDLLMDYASWISDYKRFSLIVGYRIL